MRLFVGLFLLVGMFAGIAHYTSADSSTPQKGAEHGRYITQQVAMCIQCHTPRDASGELIRSRLFDGAPIPVGKPASWNSWAEYAPRIAGLPQYSEGQMMTLLTTGIGRDGKVLRAPMPGFRMTREDAEDVIAYLRSVQ